MSISQNIVNYLESQKDNYIQDLQRLIEFETPSDNPIYIKECFHFIRSMFQAIGYESQIYPGKNTGGVLYLRPKHREKNNAVQLLIGHIDTVWPIGTLKSMLPSVDQEKVKGPGVFDMKSGLLNILYALKAIHHFNIELSFCPLVVINSDEEIGSFESTPLIKRLAKIASRAFILEPSLDGKLKTSRSGVGKYTISLKGKAAHAGLNPDQGASAIMELSYVIQKLFVLNDPQKGVSVNVGLIDGGVRPNVIAPESKAIVDVRVPTNKDADRIDKQIKALKSENKEVEIAVEGNIGRPPMERTKRNRSLWLLAKQKAEKLDLNIEETMAGGGSDANTTSQFTATLDGLGAVGDGAHASHEFIYHDHFVERCALLSLLIMDDTKYN